MKLVILGIDGKGIGEKDLPEQFSEEIREEIIKRAVFVIQRNKRQQYGAKPYAGMRASADLSRRRRDYRGSYGLGISRVPRKIMSRQGTRMSWVGAFAPGTVGGRRAHPPKSEKVWKIKVNKKERRKAIRSAISATVNKELVNRRGHKLPSSYPFVIESKIESVNKTKEARNILKAIGLQEEISRSSKKSIRAGKGRMRNRKYRKKTGALFVVSDKCDFEKACKNIPGFSVARVKSLNAELLAPGAQPGRLTIFTDRAIDVMKQEKLFT